MRVTWTQLRLIAASSTAALFLACSCGETDTSLGSVHDNHDAGPDTSLGGSAGAGGSGGVAGIDAAAGSGGLAGSGGVSGEAGMAGTAGMAGMAGTGGILGNPVELANGISFDCARFDSGNVRCWGNDVYGQLGYTTPDRGLAPGEMGDMLPPVELGTGHTVKTLATGAHHACAILEDDSVKCWGHNRHGALGLGDGNHRSGNELGNALPSVNLGTGKTAKAISTGFDFTCAILNDDSVKCWGQNNFGQLGQGHANDVGDQPSEMGDSLPVTDLGSGHTAKFIVSGHTHACAILDDDSTKCWGFNNSLGVLGLGDNKTRGDGPNEMGNTLPSVDLGAGHHAVALTAGARHTCALLENQTLKCWGINNVGQLGQGDKNHRGDVPGEMGDALLPLNLGTGHTAKAVAAGFDYACAILENDSLKCWGENTSGQLGQGDVERRGDDPGEMGDALPAISLGTGRTALRITAGSATTCATLDDSSHKCWGSNATGTLGLGDNANRGDQPNEMGDLLPAVPLGTGLTAAALGRGTPNVYQCAVLNDASVKCWGSNYFGELGSASSSNLADEPNELPSIPWLDFGTGRTATSIGAGSYTLCALLDDKSVKCMGQGGALLGQGDTRTRGARPADRGDNLPAISLGTGHSALALAVGSDHACAILDDQSLKCWGSNSVGQLGIEDKLARGDDASELGDALPTVNLGTGRTAVKIFAGARASCAILDNAELKCWGSNIWGRLGYGDTNDRGDVTGEMGDALPAVNLGTGRTAVSVAIGANSLCAILDDQTLKCWGGGGQGLLGTGNGQAIGDQANEMGDSLPIVNLAAGVVPNDVGVGDQHVCVVLSDNQVKCWGDNASGQLGLGDTSDRGDQPGEMGSNLPFLSLGTGKLAVSVKSAAAHTCAIFDDASIKCWGDNDVGQLGLGDNETRGDQAGEMGDTLGVVGF